MFNLAALRRSFLPSLFTTLRFKVARHSCDITTSTDADSKLEVTIVTPQLVQAACIYPIFLIISYLKLVRKEDLLFKAEMSDKEGSV